MKKRAKNAGGRPRKFDGPSRPVTVTLPEKTLEQLTAIDLDRAQAIVRATESVVPRNRTPDQLVEIVRVATGIGMLIVPSSKRLSRIPHLNLVEVAPSRYLITVKSGMSPAAIEVAVSDELENTPPSEQYEWAVLKKVHELLRQFRRSQKVSKAEVLFIEI